MTGAVHYYVQNNFHSRWQLGADRTVGPCDELVLQDFTRFVRRQACQRLLISYGLSGASMNNEAMLFSGESA